MGSLTERLAGGESHLAALLGNRDFLGLLAGRLVTNAGDSLYAIAAIWLVYSLGGSTLWTGVAAFLTTTPRTLQFLVGPLVDRWPLREVFVGTQLSQAVLVLAIPAAAALDSLSVFVVLAVIPVASMINQFVYPAQNAALPRIVSADRLVTANSAFSLAYQGTNLAFNAVGGVLVAVVGAVALYLVDAATFVLAALLFASVSIGPPDEAADDPAESRSDPDRDAADAEDARPDVGDRSAADDDPEGRDGTDGRPGRDGTDGQSGPDDSLSREADDDSAGYLEELRDGLAYVRGTMFVWLVFGLAVTNGTVGVSFAVLPAFADLRGGPEVYGALVAALAAGTLVGAVIAPRLRGFRLGRLVSVGFLLGGLAWLAAVYATDPAVVVALFGLAWVPVGVLNVNVQTLVQTVAPEDLIGRVSSVTISAALAVQPAGALLGGAAGGVLGSVAVMVAAPLGFFAIAVLFLAVPALRALPGADSYDAIEA